MYTAELNLFRSIPLFRYLDDEDLRRLLRLAKLRKFGVGEELIAEYSCGTETFVLLRGRAQVMKSGLKVGELGAGECFGEMSMFENAPRSASIRAEVAGELISFGRAALFPLFHDHPKLAIKLLWAICQGLNGKLRKTTENLAEARLK